MTRLFVALRPPAPIRDALLMTIGGVEGARWQDDGQLHLTLRFVGEIDPPQAEDLAAELGRIEAPRFELKIAGVGHFEKKDRLHALWAAVVPSPPLDVLQQKVERACQRIGLEPEHRKFTPHLTLARLGGRSGAVGEWLAANGALSAGPWPIDEFRLYESQLTPAGPLYEPIISYRLRG